MPVERAAPSILAGLRASGLLSDAQLDELVKCPEARDPAPTPLARVVFQRGWLTRFQLNMVAAGRSKELIVGPYVVLDRLGEGGMGMVYKARHQHMQRTIALKVILKEKLAGGDAVKRFYQEVQVAAALHHPNIALAYDAGQAGNTHYLAMEYIEGVDLARLVKEKGPLPVAQACDYVRQAALGLQHAHEKGLVHRDVKPHNLLVSRAPTSTEVSASATAAPRGDVVKLLDMGLARLQSGGDTGLTKTGAVMGTPDYLAPEQAMNSKAADIRADLYSLGCTLHYLLTGKPPFVGGELTEVLLKHQMEQPVPLADQDVDAPEEVQAILDRLMAKNPDDRYQTPAELVEDLAPFCREGTLAAGAFDFVSKNDSAGDSEWGTQTLAGDKDRDRSRTTELPRPRRKKGGRDGDQATDRQRRLRKMLVVGGAVALAALGLLAVGLYWKFGRTPTDERAEGPAATGQSPKGTPTQPDRDNPTPPAGDGDKPLVVAQPVSNPPAPGGIRVMQNLPWFDFAVIEGRVLVVRESLGTLLVKVPAMGKDYRFNGAGMTIDGFALSDDGRRLVIAYSDRALHVWEVGGTKELHTLRGHAEPIACVAVSSDGRLALSGGGKADGTDAAIRVWDLAEGKELRKLEGHQAKVARVALAADGKRAVSVGDDGEVRVWDVDGGKELLRLDALKAAVPQCAALSPDGGRLLVGDRQGNVILLDAKTGQEVRRFAKQGGWIWDVAFAPDGKRAVSAAGPDPGGNQGAVRVWNLDQTNPMLILMDHQKSVRRVAVADGGRLVYSAGEDGLLCRRPLPPLPGSRVEPPPATGPGKLVPLPGAPGGVVMTLALSPDGKRLAFGSSKVRIWDVEGNKLVGDSDKTIPFVRCLAWSADGKKLLAGGYRGQVHLLDAATARVEREFIGHTSDVHAVAFSPDGRFALTGSGGPRREPSGGIVKGPNNKPIYEDAEVRRWDVATGKDVERYRGPTREANAVAFSADGKHVLADADHFEDSALYDWDVDKPDAPRRVAHLRGRSPVFSPDRKELALVANVSTIYVYDVKTGAEARRCVAVERALSLGWSGDGRYIACGTGSPTPDNPSGAVYLLEAASCRELKKISGYANTVLAAGVSAGGRQAVASVVGDGVRVVTLDPGDLPRMPDTPGTTSGTKPFTGHDGTVLCVAFSPEGAKLLSGGKDKTVRLWDVATGKELKRFKQPVTPITHVGFAGKGAQVVAIAADSGFASWDLDTENVNREVGARGRSGWSLAPDGELLIAPQKDIVPVWKTVEPGKREHTFFNRAWGPIVASAFSPDEPAVVFAGSDGRIHICDLTTDKEAGKGFAGPSAEVTHLAVAPKLAYVVTVDEKNNVTLWSLKTLQPVRRFTGLKEKVYCLTFSPDGKHLVTGGADAVVRVWDLAGKEVAQSTEHKEAVRGVAFSPDGKSVVSCGDGIKVWEWQKPPAKP